MEFRGKTLNPAPRICPAEPIFGLAIPFMTSSGR
jgi:hypothetical protein